MVYDPASDTIRWRNLSHVARARVDPDDDGFTPDAQSDEAVEVVVSEVLDAESFEGFINRQLAYLDATGESALLMALR